MTDPYSHEVRIRERYRLSPRTMFKALAVAEAVTWAALLIAIFLRATGSTDVLVRPAGGIHGFVFLAYCVVTVCVWVDGRWHPLVGATGLASSVIPFATIIFELWADQRGCLARSWRVGAESEEPLSFTERLLAWALRHVALSTSLFVALVTVAFLVLLRLGPPVQF